ncbi:hypothetical protein [Geminisphaera colitermitum]|uniref:hypothetical protein n=1 Tax=Geminisphaera colitermitum TaxID=1148786 RepID=UPI000158D365|nr:hypothetical protein [Geminisphaera colitermitum]
MDSLFDLSSSGTLSNLLNTGLQYFGSYQTSKNEAEVAKAQAQAAAAQAAAAQAKSAATGGGFKLSTGHIIGLAVAVVLALGGIVLMARRR